MQGCVRLRIAVKCKEKLVVKIQSAPIANFTQVLDLVKVSRNQERCASSSGSQEGLQAFA